MPWAEFKGERVQYQELPHESGGGSSYNIRVSSDPKDVVHLDTKRGTVFSDEEIVAMAVFIRIERKHENRTM